METWSPWRAPGPAVLLAILLFVTACAVPGASTSALVETEEIATDTGRFTASYTALPANASATLSEDEARERASRMVTREIDDASVRARRLLMTLAAENGEVVTRARDAWLVTYSGVPFEPDLGCTCYIVTWPATTVALDSHTGEVLFVFGSGAS